MKSMKSIGRLMMPFLPLLLMLLPAPAARAQEVLEEAAVSTASRFEEPVFESTSQVVVLTGDAIRDANVLLLPDVLRRVPGLNIIQFGGKGKQTAAFLRGASPKNTLDLIDGVRAGGEASGGFEFGGLPVDDIERIEIVKGPRSAIYGSGAQAGVINIITKKGGGARLGVDAGADYGSYRTYRPSLSVSGLWKGVDYRLTASYFETEGISAAKSGEEKDGYENKSVSGKFGFRPVKNAEVELSGRYSEDRSELDGFDGTAGLPVDDPDFIQKGERHLVSAKGRVFLRKDWEQVLTLSTLRDTVKGEDPEDVQNNYTFETGTDEIDWQHNVYSDGNVLTLGAEYREDRAKHEGGLDRKAENRALYLNTKVGGNGLILSAGLRYDDHEIAGSKTTWQIGAVEHRKDSGLTFRASYGTGFRAPTLNEVFLFGRNSGEELKPEESAAWEVGMQKAAGRAVLAVTYFDQDYENFIDGSGDGTISISKADINGVETSLFIAFSEHLGLSGAYTYLKAEDNNTSERLPGRPENKFNAEASYDAERFNLLADYTYVGERPGTGEEGLDPYGLVNLSGTLRLTKRISLTARAENILDEDYEEASGYGTPGRSYYGGLRASF